MPKPLPTPHLEQARAATGRRAWGEAFDALTRADADAPLDADDLVLLATAAYLTGRAEAFVSAFERAHRLHREAGASADAARCAFWIGFHLTEQGEGARAGGWLARAARLLEGVEGEHVERGYLLIPAAYQRFTGGHAEEARALAAEAARVAERFGDSDLLALALHVQGRALLAAGALEQGLALLDEAMVGAAADELSPTVTGLLYCSVIGACRSVWALGRAHEWTAALAHWCERQPDMVAYRGECRVYRSELLQLHGAWDEALAEADAAAERFAGERGPAAALAHYQRGEVHRLRGELDAAEEAYRAASRAGREPQPGLALLRLARGDAVAAAASSRRALSETRDPARRARLLPAHVDIMIAAGDPEEARRACGELAELAGGYGSPALAAMAAHARGAVALAAGQAADALPHLRRAAREWRALEAPYEVGRARMLVGLACRALGDDDGAGLELEAAHAAFARLGAAPDVARVEASLEPRARTEGWHGLTPREVEVLALVATGKTNRTIADELFISEKTVARHVSNIFAKLDLSSRAAATAYAYEHHLVGPPA